LVSLPFDFLSSQSSYPIIINQTTTEIKESEEEEKKNQKKRKMVDCVMRIGGQNMDKEEKRVMKLEVLPLYIILNPLS